MAVAARREWKENWTVVLAAAFGVGMTSSPTYTLGAFMVPLQEEFGWGRAQIAGLLSIATILSSLTAPFIGRMGDAHGARRSALAGTAIFILAIASFAAAGPSLLMFNLQWIVLATGIAFASPVVWTMGVGTRFMENRGMALAITLTGSNMAGVVTPLLVTTLIQSFGWREGYLGLAIFLLLSTLPLAFFFFYDSSDLDRRRKRVTAMESGPPTTRDGLSLREAIRTKIFWLLFVSLFMFGCAAIGCTVHFIPMLRDGGLSALVAASAASSLALGSAIGRFSEAFIIDRVFAPRIAMAVSFPCALACLALILFSVTAKVAFLYALVFGLAIGAEGALVSYLTARYFGLKAYGAVYGIVFAAFSTGAGFFPPVMGWLYDWQGNYTLALIVTCVFYAASGTLLQFCGRYPHWQSSTPQRELQKTREPA